MEGHCEQSLKLPFVDICELDKEMCCGLGPIKLGEVLLWFFIGSFRWTSYNPRETEIILMYKHRPVDSGARFSESF